MMIHAKRYDSLETMWWETTSELLRCPEIGSRDGKSREMTGFVGQYPADEDWVWNKTRAASPVYGVGELLWYLSGSNDGKVMEAYAPQYPRFCDNDMTAYGAYGKRMADYDQLRYVYELLKDQPDTRQAIISMWHPKDLNAALRKAHNDIPCTLSLQFLRRNGWTDRTRAGELHLIVTMRSNDVWLGLPYDGWCFSQILKIMASSLGIPAGVVQHQVGSMHLYDRNAEKAEEAIKGGPQRRGPRMPFPKCHDFTGAGALIKHVLETEEEMRMGNYDWRELLDCELGGSIGEWLGLLAEKFGPEGTRAEWLDERLRKQQ